MWLAVNENGQEKLFEEKPLRYSKSGIWRILDPKAGRVNVPKGTILRLIGRELTWDDEPVDVRGYAETITKKEQ